VLTFPSGKAVET